MPDLTRNPDEGKIDCETGELIHSVNDRRRQEVDGLLQRGGVLVCFMQPLMTHSYICRRKGEDRWHFVTNYDWLPEHTELPEIKCSTGVTIDFVDSGHPFSEYLNTRPRWSAYVEKDACKNWKVLASAFETHAVSLAKRVGLGNIILLPSYYDYHNGELLERCIVKLLGDKKTMPQPGWAKDVLVPGQQELVAKVVEITGKIDSLDEQRKKLTDEKDRLERWKYLLYEKGKHQLEPVVRDALALLGCNVETQPDKDSDGAVACDYGTALLEVVGSNGTIRIEKLGELVRNEGNFISKKGGKVKGILVGNPFCDQPLEGRPPKDSQKHLFAKELIESAEQQGITVLLSTDLYRVVCRILEGKSSDGDRRSVQERIFNGKGLVRLV